MSATTKMWTSRLANVAFQPLKLVLGIFRFFGANDVAIAVIALAVGMGIVITNIVEHGAKLDRMEIMGQLAKAKDPSADKDAMKLALASSSNSRCVEMMIEQRLYKRRAEVGISDLTYFVLQCDADYRKEVVNKVPEAQRNQLRELREERKNKQKEEVKA